MAIADFQLRSVPLLSRVGADRADELRTDVEAAAAGWADAAVLRVGYTLPGRYEWRETGWRKYIPSPVQEATQEAALQATRRLKPDVPAVEIVPTRLDLAVMYAPGGIASDTM